MRARALILSVLLCTSGLSVVADIASAAELAVPRAHRAAAVPAYRTGYVFWDDVYPPALYGPYLRSVDEVAALKAQRRPAPSLWAWGWYQ